VITLALQNKLESVVNNWIPTWPENYLDQLAGSRHSTTTIPVTCKVRQENSILYKMVSKAQCSVNLRDSEGMSFLNIHVVFFKLVFLAVTCS